MDSGIERECGESSRLKSMNLNFITSRGPSRLNGFLVEKQGLTPEEVETIKELHIIKDQLLDILEDGVNLSIAEQVRDIEFQLQIAWKFTTKEKGFNWNYWRFWTLPFCTCPKLDNEDNFPHGYYVINCSCPYHGKGLTNSETQLD